MHRLRFVFVAQVFRVASYEQYSNIWTAALEMSSHFMTANPRPSYVA